MKINKMTDYAIRVIRVFHNEGNEIITSKLMAEKEEIPQGVLMKVLRELKDHNIVQSHQGRGELKGGFSLVRSPKELTILDIVQAMEGKIKLNCCVSENKICGTEGNCQLHKEFIRINERIREELGKYSLYDILTGSAEEL